MADIRTTTKVEGPQASDAAVSDNPVIVGGRASDAVVTPVSADGDAVQLWVSRRGAVMIGELPHVGWDGAPFTLTNKNALYTTTQTGTALWTPTSGKKVAITSYTITCTGTTGGHVQLWWGASADTTFTRGTDLALYDGSFFPSATFSPGISQYGFWMSQTADHILRVTDDAAINELIVNVWGYEI